MQGLIRAIGSLYDEGMSTLGGVGVLALGILMHVGVC